MSYAKQFSPKALYASVVEGYYSETVYNPVKNMLTTTSRFPIEPSLLPGAISSSTGVTESLTCADQNPAYRCVSNMDCPGPHSNCGRCLNHQCQK